MTMRNFLKITAFFCLTLGLSTQANATDCWLAVTGSGSQDGSSAENAYAAQNRTRNAQKCWDQTSATGTMYVMEGEYSVDNQSFWRLTLGSSKDGPDNGKPFKKLMGVGHVLMTGSRPVPYSLETAAHGETWIKILKNARHIQIENFNVRRVEKGITALDGGNHHLEFRHLHFQDTRQNIHLDGHPQCVAERNCPVKKGQLSKTILLEDITGIRYSKRHIRMGHGITAVQVLNSHADAENLDGDFAVGFDVENPASGIEFRGSTSRRNRYSVSEYWNGDGFKAENQTRDIRWIDCAAFDNADAGFDIKTKNAVLENIVALRNSRNIRIWHSARLQNVNASYSFSHGGIGTEAGLWTAGKAECYFCTFHNNGIHLHAEKQDERPEIRLYDSILSRDSAHPGELLRQEEAHIELIRTEAWEEGPTGQNPLDGRTTAQWEGKDAQFNSRYGKNKGYFYAA